MVDSTPVPGDDNSGPIRLDRVAERLGGEPVRRRTIVAGAAWSVPAVLLTAATPAFATSGRSLAFGQSGYTGAGCSSITGATVAVTHNSTPEAGVSVTVTLSDGYTFSGGADTFTGISDGSGMVNIAPINVPSLAPKSTLVALAPGTTSANAMVSGTSKKNVSDKRQSDSAATNFSSIPAEGTRAVGNNYFLTSAGDLYYKTAVVASGVMSAVGYRGDDAKDHVNYVTSSDGIAHAKNQGDAGSYNFTNVVPWSTPVGHGYFLSSSGYLYYADTLVSTNVYSARGYGAGAGTDRVGFTYADTLTVQKKQGGDSSDWKFYNVPASNTRTVGQGYYLASDGGLYYGNELVASGVQDAIGYVGGDGDDYVSYVSASDGVARQKHKNDTTFWSYTNVVPWSRPVGNGYFLSSSGYLYYGDTRVATDVSTARGYLGQDLLDYVGYTALSDGVAHAKQAASPSRWNFNNVVPWSKPVGDGYFLSTSGYLYFGDTLVLTGVASAQGIRGTDGYSYVSYVTQSDGIARLKRQTDSSAWSYTNVVPWSNPVGAGYYLSSSGNLYYQNTLVASGVLSAAGYKNLAGVDRVDYIIWTNPMVRQIQQGNGSYWSFASIPPIGTRPLGNSYYLTRSGELYHENTLVASGVQDALGRLGSDGLDYIDYVLVSDGVPRTKRQADSSSWSFTNAVPWSYPVGDGYFLSSSGSLYFGNTAAATNVASARGYLGEDGMSHVNFVAASGSC